MVELRRLAALPRVLLKKLFVCSKRATAHVSSREFVIAASLRD